MGCATDDCGRADCPVCSVARRFAPPPRLTEREERHPDAPALNGTKLRASRDPRFIKRRRKVLL